MSGTLPIPPAAQSTYKPQGNEWFDYNERHQPPIASTYESTLRAVMLEYTHLNFQHIRVGILNGRKLCVFVAKDNQSAVLYDKIRGFPSSKLLASLVLLGS